MTYSNLFKNIFLFVVLAILSACSKVSLQQVAVEESLPQQTISVEIDSYIPSPGGVLEDIFVKNYSVDVSEGVGAYNSSRDTVSDAIKSADTYFGFSIGSPNSANPYFSDLLIYQLGIAKALQDTLSCPASQAGNLSNDGLLVNSVQNIAQFFGLRDCEKNYLKLDPSKFDNNQSGIPDYLQLRCRLNPGDTTTYKMSTAGDGISNYEKCKRAVPIDEDLSTNTMFALNYTNVLHSDQSMDFKVTNIPIMNGGANNLVVYYITEINPTTNVETIYSAYTLLTGDQSEYQIKFNFWGTDPTKQTNQQIQ